MTSIMLKALESHSIQYNGKSVLFLSVPFLVDVYRCHNSSPFSMEWPRRWLAVVSVSLFGLYRTHFITTAIPGFGGGVGGWVVLCFVVFFSSNLAAIFARQS